MTYLKDYLEQTNTVLLTKDAFEYLKERASALEKIRTDIANLTCDCINGMVNQYAVLQIIDKYAEQDTKMIVKNGWTKIPKCTTCKYLYSPIVPCNRCKNNSEFEPQESGLTDEMMEHYKKLAEHYNGGAHESIQDTDDGK